MSTMNQLPGLKIGMTQVFDAETRHVTPVTVIACGTWFVTQVKTSENDGYEALQIGFLRKRYAGMPFNPVWLQKKKNYFLHVKEVRLETGDHEWAVGQALTLDNTAFAANDIVSATGRSRGRGFQGVVKRWGFGGGPKTHGSNFHRKPGSIGNMASQGKVLKGKKLPGQYGNKQITVKGLRVVSVDAGRGVIFVKGAVPGKKNTLIQLRKQG